MKLGSRRTILGAMGMVAVCLVGAALAGGQQAPPAAPRPPMAEEAYRNIQILRGIPVDEFLQTMGMMAASTGLNCTHCHSGYDYDVASYAADTIELKQTARKMIVIMNTINQSFFAGQQVVSCWTCHQGEQVPRNAPSLQKQYSYVPPYEPEDALEQAPGMPLPEEILDAYLGAVGGAQRANAINSIVATGTNSGYGPESEPRPMELYATAAGRRMVVTHTADGDSTTTYDGTNGWWAVPHKPAPDPVMPLTGDDLAGAKLDTNLLFPGQIKQSLLEWRTGFPFPLGDKDLMVVQGRSSAGRPLVKLMFDPDTNLLVRQLRYTGSPIGRVPTQVDYEDYREIPGTGVMIPHKWTMTWTDSRETYELTEVRANVAIPAARFAKPAPPVAPAQ